MYQSSLKELDHILVLSTPGLHRFIPTIGQSPTWLSCDSRPSLDLVDFIPTLGLSPTWLCCDSRPSLDLVDFSSAISAGAMQYGFFDIGAVPGSSSIMNGSALSGGMPYSARNTSSNSLTSGIPSGPPTPTTSLVLVVAN